jgi:CBS domain containing-hemolysin-like protein
VDEALRIVAASPFSRLPVYHRQIDNVVGMLHTKDLVTAYVQGALRPALGSLLRPIARVPHDMPADRLLAFLRERRTHQALVVGEGGAVVGLITLEDVLAELLGGVADEFKQARARHARLRDEEPR